MAITYSWKIIEMKKNDVEGYDSIASVTWEKIGTDEKGNTGKFSQMSAVPLPDPQNLESLSEEQAISWIQAHIDENMINKLIETEIQFQIDKLNFIAE